MNTVFQSDRKTRIKHRLVMTSFLVLILLFCQDGQTDVTELIKQLPANLQPLKNSSGANKPGSTSGLGQGEMVAGLKEALSIGVKHAIETLGKKNGFLGDSQVRIPLPPSLMPIDKLLNLGPAKPLRDRFIETLNQAAEQAVPVTADIFAQSIRNMTIRDAAQILQGSDDAATQYFKKSSSVQLINKIRPIVTKTTQEAGVTASYKSLMGTLPQSGVGLLSKWTGQDATDLDGYITKKSVDGLFIKLADEEKQIRTNPVARTTGLLQKVFGLAR
ncbi:MAG: DUF4197 domain-containing protein [Magnetococcus sp. YQC-5]